jgi:hypothetical protein
MMERTGFEMQHLVAAELAAIERDLSLEGYRISR